MIRLFSNEFAMLSNRVMNNIFCYNTNRDLIREVIVKIELTKGLIHRKE